MITSDPYKYTGEGIIYPDKAVYVDGMLHIDNYWPSVLGRGLDSIAAIAGMLERMPAHAFMARPNTATFQGINEDGLATRIGLTYGEADAVKRAVKKLAYELYNERLPDDEVRHRAALLGFTAVAEAQMLTMANNRAGRVIYGRIQYGHEPQEIKRGVDAILDDEVPLQIERLVLLQNMARCRHGIEPDLCEYGGVYVSAELERESHQRREALDQYRIAVGEAGPIWQVFDRNFDHLAQQLMANLQDKELAYRATSILMQEDYGPAAWLLCSNGIQLSDITPDTVEHMQYTNTKLLQMRILTLLNAVANGGNFVRIADNDKGDTGRTVHVINWTPTEVA